MGEYRDEKTSVFFFGRINMQVYVDFEGSTMASFFRIFGGVSTAGA